VSNFRFKIKLACSIANVDRQQFNEAVSKGFYRCAPTTAKGATRMFDIFDMLALMVFGQLLQQHNQSAKEAGELACEAYGVLRECANKTKGSPDIFDQFRYLAIAHGEMGSPIVICCESSDDGWSLKPAGGGVIRSLEAFNIKAFRDQITARAEYERANPILGED